MKVLIIDDDISFVTEMRRNLEEIGIDAVRVESSEEGAINAIREYDPELVICDIMLNQKSSGLTLSVLLSERHIAFIIVTQYKNEGFYEEIIRSEPIGYFIKPIDHVAFRYTINTLIKERVLAPTGAELLGNPLVQYLFIKKKSKYEKVRFADIRFIHAQGNYTTFHCTDQKYVVKSSLRKCRARISGDKLIQVHRNYIVNINFINSLEGSKNALFIDEQKVPIGRAFKMTLMQKLPLFK